MTASDCSFLTCSLGLIIDQIKGQHFVNLFEEVKCFIYAFSNINFLNLPIFKREYAIQNVNT